MDHAELFKGLNAAGVEYLVTGGLALVFHGVPRMSFDVDLTVRPDGENIGKLKAFLSARGYRPGETAGAVLRFVHDGEDISRIDAAVETPAPYEQVAGRSRAIHLHETPVSVMSLDDLVTVKERMGRPEDREDIKGIEILRALERGEGSGQGDELRRDQVSKFLQWPVENRSEWLLTSIQLQKAQSGQGRGRGGLRGQGGLKGRKIRGLRHTDLS